MTPTDQEFLEHWRENARLHLESLERMLAQMQRSKHRAMFEVTCVMPWRAALIADKDGSLWPICEMCEKPIKNDAEYCSEPESGCSFHLACVGDGR